MARTTLTVDNVVAAMVKSVKTLADAESAFIASAVITCRALRGGVSAAEIGRKAKATGLAGMAYTSTPAVCYHGRTGAVLLLDGDDLILPEDVLVQNVQTLVRALPAADVDAIIADSETVTEAYAAMLAAVAKAKRAKDRAAKVGPVVDALAPVDETDETTDAPAAPAAPETDGLDGLRSALAQVLAFVESGATVSTEAQTLLAEISATVSPLVAVAVAN